MTIRRRLAFSFLGILVLFAVNLMIYFWSNQRRQATVESLRRAIARQILLSAVNQTLNDMQKQVSLLSQVVVEAGTGGAAPAEVAQFGSQIDGARKRIAELREISDPQARQTVQEFQKAF